MRLILKMLAGFIMTIIGGSVMVNMIINPPMFPWFALLILMLGMMSIVFGGQLLVTSLNEIYLSEHKKTEK